MACFCSETGVRIAAPGVCKAVDPVNGKDEVRERADGSLEVVSVAKPAKDDKTKSG